MAQGGWEKLQKQPVCGASSCCQLLKLIEPGWKLEALGSYKIIYTFVQQDEDQPKMGGRNLATSAGVARSETDRAIEQITFWGGVSPYQPMRSIVFSSLLAVPPGNALIPRAAPAASAITTKRNSTSSTSK